MKRGYFTIVLVNTLLVFTGHAQIIRESNNIRVDPQWVVADEVGDYKVCQDMKMDREGNIYTSGQVGASIKIGDEIINTPNPDNVRYPECSFIMKRDSAGRFLWIQFIGLTI